MLLRALSLALAAVAAQQPAAGSSAQAPGDDHFLEHMRSYAALASAQAPPPAPEGRPQAEAQEPMEKEVQPATAPAPASPEACRTRGELDAWRERAAAELRAFVPGAQLGFALGSMKEKYDKRLAELEKQGAGPVRESVAAEEGGPPRRELAGSPQPPAPAGDRWEYLLRHAGDFDQCTQLRVRVQLPRGAVEFPVLLATAEMCQTERDLRTWRTCQLAEVRDHVPRLYRAFVVDVLRAQFEQHLAALAPEGGPGIGAAPAPLPLARLAATVPQLPAFLAVAAVCGTEPELLAWHAHELARLDGTVPKEYRRFAASALERTFQRRLAQLVAAAGGGGEAAATVAATQPPAPPPAAAAGSGEQREALPAEATPGSGLSSRGAALELAAEGAGAGHLPLKATVLILGGLALPALLSFAAGAASPWGGQAALRKELVQEEVPEDRELWEHGAYHLQV